jgi:hypothetical protein
LKVGGEAIEVYHNIVWLHTPQRWGLNSPPGKVQ